MNQPTFVYDDDCGVCTWWATRLAEHTDLRIVGFTDLDPTLESRLPADYERCSHLVTDDETYSCGEAIEEALLRTGLGSLARPPVTVLRRFGPYRTVRELSYRLGADNRTLWAIVLPTDRPDADDPNES